jgi:hypothetical protein
MFQAVMSAEEEHCSMALCYYLFNAQAADCVAAEGLKLRAEHYPRNCAS